MWNLRFIIVITLLFITPLSALAHHGSSGQFDTSTTVELSGKVTRIKLVNPHSYVYFDSTDEDGVVTNKRCELQSGSLLKRHGWTADMFAIGSQITILGSPDRTDPTTCYMNQVIFENGITASRDSYFNDDGALIDEESVGAPEEEKAAELSRAIIREDGTPNIDGNWSWVREERRGGGRGEGGGPPSIVLTPAGESAVEDAASEENPRYQCKATNIIMDWWFDGIVNKISQTDSAITLKYGFMNIERTIYLDGREMPADYEPSRAGFSTGEWQGDTLVVTTAGFDEGWIMAPMGSERKPGGKREGGDRPEFKEGDKNDKRPPGPPGGPPSPAKNSTQLTVTEYFTLDDDGRVLNRKYTLTDPLYLEKPFSGSDKVTFTLDDYEDYACDDLTTEREATIFKDKVDTGSTTQSGIMSTLYSLEDSSVGTLISSTEWGYAIVLSLHAIGMAILVGVSLMLSIRVLGFASFIPVTAMAPYWRVAQGGFVLNLFSGIALFCGSASEMYFNWAFRTKIVLVFVGLLLTWWLVKICIKRSDKVSTAHARLAAVTTLIWVLAIIAGRLIGCWS
jgi:hypothetical protein